MKKSRTSRTARPVPKRKVPSGRPIRENLLRQLKYAREYRESLREFESAGFNCGYSILRAEEEINKLTQLVS